MDVITKKICICGDSAVGKTSLIRRFVTGRYDLLAMVVTESPEELSRFIEKEISAIPGILRTETFVNLDIMKGKYGLMDTVKLVRNLIP